MKKGNYSSNSKFVLKPTATLSIHSSIENLGERDVYVDDRWHIWKIRRYNNMMQCQVSGILYYKYLWLDIYEQAGNVMNIIHNKELRHNCSKIRFQYAMLNNI